MENRLLTNKHILVCLHNREDFRDFCGKVVHNFDFACDPDAFVYLYGDIAPQLREISHKNILVIEELSCNYEGCTLIGLGEVPMNVRGIGVYFREFFKDGYFDAVTKAHTFQSLTESNKEGAAYRKGIYLTNVTEDLKFNLLRCSSNLNGPTENFAAPDREIVSMVNDVSKHFFQYPTTLNHVLAQTYHNSRSGNKERKARIKRHSDKTKDMPRTGLIAFCTFYDKVDGRREEFDYKYGNASQLTMLHFREKKNPDNRFNITLYPNSLFIIALDTNRLYTHEIRPSVLPIDHIPTRMGYVIRCSDTEAQHVDGQTYIIRNGKRVPLQPPTAEGVARLKKLYYVENALTDMVFYEGFDFSLNGGDYMAPIV